MRKVGSVVLLVAALLVLLALLAVSLAYVQRRWRRHLPGTPSQDDEAIDREVAIKPVLSQPFSAEEIWRLYCWYVKSAQQVAADGKGDPFVALHYFTEEIAELGPDVCEPLWEAVRTDRTLPPESDLPPCVHSGLALDAIMKVDRRHRSACYAELLVSGQFAGPWEARAVLEGALRSDFVLAAISGLASLAADLARPDQERERALAIAERLVQRLEEDLSVIRSYAASLVGEAMIVSTEEPGVYLWQYRVREVAPSAFHPLVERLEVMLIGAVLAIAKDPQKAEQIQIPPTGVRPAAMRLAKTMLREAATAPEASTEHREWALDTLEELGVLPDER